MELSIELYKKMFLIRKSEEMIQKYYIDDKAINFNNNL